MVAAKPPEGREDGARPTERCQGATPSRPQLARGSDPSAEEKTVSGEEPWNRGRDLGLVLRLGLDLLLRLVTAINDLRLCRVERHVSVCSRHDTSECILREGFCIQSCFRSNFVLDG